jgi:fatty acyl-CoA reductase
MVVNAALASMARHGRASPCADAGMHVYHVSSGTTNPLVYDDLFQFFYHHFTRSPLVDAAGQPNLVEPMRFRDSMQQYVSDLQMNALAWGSSRTASRRLRAKTIERIIHLGRIYEPYTFYGGRFSSANTEALLAEMSAEERMRFPFDARSVDWMDYFTNVHIPGLKKHVMKGRGVTAAKPQLAGTSI